MALVLYDTNILIDALKGYTEALDELTHWENPSISAITWMEIYAGAAPEDKPSLDAFFSEFGFQVIHTNDAIMARTAMIRGDSIRNKPKIALPDAIILATGIVGNLTIITRNFKDFKGANVRLPYELEKGKDGKVTVVNVRPKELPGTMRIAHYHMMRWTEQGRPPAPTIVTIKLSRYHRLLGRVVGKKIK